MSDQRREFSAGGLSITGQARYEFIRDLLLRDCPPPAVIVEFGSAPGDQIGSLARLGYSAVSVDLGEAEDAWGSGEPGYFRTLLAAAEVENITWDIEEIPYPLPSARFDAAILTEVLEHLRNYPLRSLKEISRVLKPGGRLYLTTPNAAYLVTRARLLTGRSVYTPLADWIGGLPHARHAREYTFAEVEELLHQAGFRILESQSRHFHLDSGRSSVTSKVAKIALDRLARWRKTLGPAIVITAERE